MCEVPMTVNNTLHSLVSSLVPLISFPKTAQFGKSSNFQNISVTLEDGHCP